MLLAIIAAAIGGFLVGATVFYYVGKMCGFASGVACTLRVGAAIAQGQATAAPAVSIPTQPSSRRGMN